MPERPPSGHSAGRPEDGAGNVTYLDQALWRQLAEATTAEQYGHAWLGLQARIIGGVSAGVVFLERPESGSLAPAAFWPRGFGDPTRFREGVERALRERKGVVTRGDSGDDPGEPRYRLAFPVRDDTRVCAVAALEIQPRPRLQLESAMRQLQWGAAWLENWVLRGSDDAGGGGAERMAVALELTALTLETTGFKAAATAFVTELATRLRCDRVSVGFVHRHHVRVTALSHSAQFGKQMNLIRTIGAAMSEAVDQQATLVYPDPDEKSHRVLHAHEQLARDHGAQTVVTVPFEDTDGRAFGALTLERSGGEPFAPDEVALCDSLAALTGPLLEEKRLNDRHLVVKTRDALWSQVQKLIGPRHALRKLVVSSLLLLVLFFTFAKGTYRITAETVLEGQVQRVVAAPFRGFIDEAPVRAGDIVEQGQVLLTLDARDLRLEYSKWSSERQQYVLEQRKAMADGDPATMKVLEKKINQADAQLQLLQEQLDRTRIVAPFDGLVVSGDLSQALGAPVEAGELLFEIAPLDVYRVMLRVDEGDIDNVEVGQSGELILTAMPASRLGFRVSKITPVSLSEEGRNFFLVESELDTAAEGLRPGMQGFGKIEVDRRRLIWIWTHGLIDWIRLKAWSWLP